MTLPTLPFPLPKPTCPYCNLPYLAVQDSVITPEIAVDLMVACHSIGETSIWQHNIIQHSKEKDSPYWNVTKIAPSTFSTVLYRWRQSGLSWASRKYENKEVIKSLCIIDFHPFSVCLHYLTLPSTRCNDDRVLPEDAYGHVLEGRLNPDQRSALLQSLGESSEH